MVAAIEDEHRGAAVLGVDRLVAEDPDHRPVAFVRSPAPRCHAVLARIRQRFLEAYDAFADAYRAASLRIRQHKDATRLHIQQQYPLGSLVRPRWYPRWYIPAPADFVHPWRHGVDDADLALA